ncbi:MAG: SDR family NAD(P)-dependent oxidoreductase [Actinomycetia bacterium]|nr:SDR family NAD(P)-dependent oxidoreductase [Actinomycetes bacterium]
MSSDSGGRPRTVLVTGGAGYIGSHTCVALIQHGYQVVVVDDHSNSSPEALARMTTLTGVAIPAYRVDIRDRTALAGVFGRHRIDVVMHFAAKKSVPESTRMPLRYIDVNVTGTISVLNSMLEHGVRRLVYSSSCALYGGGHTRPSTESDPPAPTNPYAWTKWTCEQIVGQICLEATELSVISLRYFNPLGAHPSGILGEAPTGPLFDVMPHLNRVAAGESSELEHIDDRCGLRVFNIGTGVGTSVLQLRATFAAASGREVRYIVRDRRPGDVAVLIADPSRIAAEWDWRCTLGLDDMCRDAWRFHCRNPHGYPTPES